MAIVRLSIPVEGPPPGGWPAVPGSHSIPPAAIWRRLEHWAGRYFVLRPITVEAEGPGFLIKQDVVFDMTAHEVMDWTANDFIPAGVIRRKGGRPWLDGGRYRLTGTAGMNLRAYPEITYAAGMFARYLAEVQKQPEGAHIAAESYNISLGGDISEGWKLRRSPVAMALYDSGAAAMLMPFKNIKGRFQ